jgi:hypothetical protein
VRVERIVGAGLRLSVGARTTQIGRPEITGLKGGRRGQPVDWGGSEIDRRGIGEREPWGVAASEARCMSCSCFFVFFLVGNDRRDGQQLIAM